LFCFGQYISGLAGMFKRLAHVSWYYGSVIEEVEQTAAILGEDDLLLGSLNGGSEVDVEGLLDFLTSLSMESSAFVLTKSPVLTYNVGELSFSDQVLSLGSHEFLLEGD
jgi:hypothetical protein